MRDLENRQENNSKIRYKMENIQVLNDGADEEDLKELLEILKGFGQVEVLYDPNDPKDKDVTADDVIGRYENFKKQARKDGSRTKECIQDITEGTGKRRRRSYTSDTNTTISTAA